jgi:putative ABC transport system permease protein
MGIPIVRGRPFTERDAAPTAAVVIINRLLADQLWPGADPIGRRVKRTAGDMTVVGIVDDASDVDLLQPPQPTLYAAWTQTANVAFPMALVLRTAGDPEALAPALRSAVRSVDPLLALDRIQSVESFLSASLAPQTFRTTLMLGLGVVGLMLGAIGIAGVTARTIAERMPEFGVRLALGCAGADLWRQVVFHQLRIALLGAAIGLGVAIVSGRLLASMLPETAGFDAAVATAAIALLAATATLSAAFPASRVLRLNPLVILYSRG